MICSVKLHYSPVYIIVQSEKQSLLNVPSNLLLKLDKKCQKLLGWYGCRGSKVENNVFVYQKKLNKAIKKVRHNVGWPSSNFSFIKQMLISQFNKRCLLK